MSGRGSASTLSEHAHERIRQDILTARLAPGQPLRLAALAADLGVSMSVVREALTRLSEQGLVTASPNQGFRVVPLSGSDLSDLTSLRVTLECSALERSIAQGDVAWEGLVVSSHHVLERAGDPDSATPDQHQQWSLAHSAFHDALSAACGSPRLLNLVRTLRDGAEIYRQWSGPMSKEYGRDVAREHRTLMELATARRADEACAALKYHIETTTRILLDSQAMPPTAAAPA
ncbi:GntR family transcriptional regulator [Mycolicibacterium sphagni]|uniref:GntR family transcriptional regulator n=1 Tax=Mycolicibacterium sphagni TaxID=1786 RepID=UPI0021F3A506|nr:GntR family transcriptional regulator [Mycolicibacterium sphagni]MCV7174209.1 GntR family transcriptional regulator [Mycolicibacterium sphagni]